MSGREPFEVEETAGREPDPGAEKLVYKMDGWSAGLQSAFCNLLDHRGIPYEHDAAGGLEVRTADKDAVESALDDFGKAAKRILVKRRRRTTAGKDHVGVELTGLGAKKPMTEGKRKALNITWSVLGRQILRRLIGG